MMNYIVVSYDICDDMRRNKVAEVLKDYGRRVQYSLFESQLDEKELEALLQEIKPLIDFKADKLRIYKICQACLRRTMGFGKGANDAKARFIVV
jgi:CRISPR-associated protein Cas2